MGISEFFQDIAAAMISPVIQVTVGTDELAAQSAEVVDKIIPDEDFTEIVEKALVDDTEKIAIQAWAVIVAMWNKIPKSIRTAVKFILWILIITGISFIPFMILIIHYLYTFIKNNPELLLAL